MSMYEREDERELEWKMNKRQESDETMLRKS